MKPCKSKLLFLICTLLVSVVYGQNIVGTDGTNAIPELRKEGLYYYSTTFASKYIYKEYYCNDSINCTLYFEGKKRGFLKKTVEYKCVSERWNYPMSMLTKVKNRLNKSCYRVGMRWEYLVLGDFYTVELILVEDYFVIFYKLKN